VTSVEFCPGTKQEYNNFNFAVTGMTIEAVSGMKYLKFMKQKVLARYTWITPISYFEPERRHRRPGK
jgi:hypothetical protein